MKRYFGLGVVTCVVGAAFCGTAGAVSDGYLGVADRDEAVAEVTRAAAGGDWARAGWLEMVYAGDEDAALRYFGRALKEKPQDVAALEGTAWLYFLHGRMPEAFQLWRQYITLYPGEDAAGAFVSLLKLFDGVVEDFAAVPDILMAVSADANFRPEIRAAAAADAVRLLLQFNRREEAASFATRAGCLTSFAVTGVFNATGLTDLDKPFEPERQLSAKPGVTFGENVWREIQSDYGLIDVGGALGLNFGVAYATTTIQLPPGEYILEVQSDDWFRIFIGGKELVARHPRAPTSPAVTRGRFSTAGGSLRLLIKTAKNNNFYANNDDRWALRLRLLDARDYRPVAAVCSPTLAGDGGGAEVIEVKKETAPEGAMAHFYRGLILAAEGAPAEAGQLIARALERAPSCVLFYVAAAYVNIVAGAEYNRADAKAYLRRARAEDPGCILATEELAVFASYEGKRDEAVAYYRETLAAEPRYVSAICGLAEIASAEGWEGEMMRRTAEAISLNGSAHRAWRLLAEYYYERGNGRAAAENFERYLAVRGDDTNARLKLAETYILLGDHEKAREEYEAVVASAPYWEEGYLGLADLASRAGDDAGARFWFGRAAAQAPRSAEVRRQWGLYLCAHGDVEGGGERLKEALALAPADYRLRHYLERRGWLRRDAIDEALAPPEGVLELARELKAETYPRADAAMLLDQTVVYLHHDFSFRESNLNYIKVFNDKAREKWGEITVRGGEGTEIVQARTHLPAGGAADAVSVKDAGDYKIISMEKVGVGAVLEIAYDLNLGQRMIFNLLEFYSQPFYMAEFGEALLCTRFALVVGDDFPAAERIIFDVGHQKLKPRRVRGDGRTAYIFERRNVPPLEEEMMMPSRDGFVPYVRITTLRDVATLAEWFRGELWGKAEPDGFLQALAAEVVAEARSDAEKAAAIYYYVVKNVESSGGGIYYPTPARLTAFRGAGRPVDRAVLILALCRAVGVPAQLVLVGTGGTKGEWRTVTPEMFDTVLVYFPTVGADGTYADPFFKDISFGDIWSSAYGKPALVLDDGGYYVRRLPATPFAKDNIGLELTIALDAGGGAVFSGRRVYRGLRSAYRLSFLNPEEQETNVEISLSQIFSGATVEDFNFENLHGPGGDFVLNFSGRAPTYARARGDKLALGVVPYPFTLGQVFISSETRRYPLRIERPEAWVEEVRIKLPAGYVVAAVPASYRAWGPKSEYELNVEVGADELTVKRRLFIDQGDVPVKDYPKFVRFCREVDRAEKAEILIAPRPEDN